MSLSILLAIVAAASLIVAEFGTTRWIGTRRRPFRLVLLTLTLSCILGLGIPSPWRIHLRGIATSIVRAHRIQGFVGSYTPEGDPGLVTRLLAREPSYPYPSEDTTSASGWRMALIGRLRRSLDYDLQDSEKVVEVARIHSELVNDGVLRSLVEFHSYDGTHIPAFVCRPEHAETRLPGVLVIPGHGQGIIGSAGIVLDYQRNAALELARMGFVTMAPELRGFGCLGEPLGLDHRVVALNAMEAGSSYKEIVAKDLQYALNVLGRQPDVDPERIGVIGASFGGELAMMMAVLDPRIRAAAVNSFGMHVGPVADPEALRRFTLPHGCHMLPATAPFLYWEDWCRLIAPRPLLVIDGDSDLRAGRKTLPGRVASFAGLVREAYAREGASDRVEIAVVPGQHILFVAETRGFLARWLGE